MEAEKDLVTTPVALKQGLVITKDMAAIVSIGICGYLI